MNDQVANVGELFRSKRSEQGMTLKQVENATSIRINYLQAIEDGKIGHNLSPVYAKGFVKQYASFLQLDGDKIVRENPHVFRPPDRQEFSYGIGTLEHRGTPGGGVKWMPNIIWAGVTIGIIAVGWYVAKYLGVF